MLQQLPTSIAGRLVALYALSSGGILLLSGLLMYGTMSLHLTAERTQFLADEIQTLATVQAQHPTSLDALREEIDVESDSSHALPYRARVLQAGRVLVESGEMTSLLPPAAFPLAAPWPEHSPPRAVPLVVDGRHYMLMSAEVQLRTQNVQRVFQLAVDATADDVLRGQYLHTMALVVVLGIWLSAGAGWVIAQRGLRPLRVLAERASQINASHLHERVGTAPWPAELGALTAAFDQMLARLEDAFARLSQFSADLAHELRTPINNLMGESEVALTRSRSSSDYRRVLESNLEECRRMARLIDNLLFIARAEHAESVAQVVQVDARSELDAIVEFYDVLSEEQGVRISTSGHGHVLAEPVLLQRAVSNVLSNALKHSPKGGHIMVHITESEDGAEISVTDDGPGIAEEHLPRIFDRFYRADSARGSETSTGLGLSLVQTIMALHRGRVQIDSQVGQGTTVRLHFPAHRTTPTTAARPAASPAGEVGSRPR